MLYGMATSPRALPTARELAVMARIATAADALGMTQASLARAESVSRRCPSCLQARNR